MRILFKVTNQTLIQMPRGNVVSESQDYLYAKFLFSDDWDGTIKIAQFKRDEYFFAKTLDENGECKVPWEILRPEGSFNVAVLGNNAPGASNKIITTNSLDILVYKTGCTLDQLPDTPSIGISGELIAMLFGYKNEAAASAAAAAQHSASANSSAVRASDSAEAAALSATSAGASASAALSRKNDAATSATEAAHQATASANSATAAGNSATAASTKATEAANSAGEAAISAGKAELANEGVQNTVVEANRLLAQFNALIGNAAVHAIWNSETTYSPGDCVMTDDGSTYRCLQISTNNPPITSPEYWAAVSTSTLDTFEYNEYGDLIPRVSPASYTMFWELNSYGDIVPTA